MTYVTFSLAICCELARTNASDSPTATGHMIGKEIR